MPDLSSLKITKAPAAFAEMQTKHNATIALLETIEGSLGIDVHVVAPKIKPPSQKSHAHAAKPKSLPKGKIKIVSRPDALAAQIASMFGSGTANASQLHYKGTNLQIDIDGNGIKLINLTTGSYVYIYATGFVEIKNGATSKTLQLDPTLITQDMTVREIDVCSGGVAKKMLIVASAPY